MFEIKILQDKDTAIKVGEFLIGHEAFEQTWTPNEKQIVEQAPIDSLIGINHKYCCAKDNGKIIGALGVRENKYGSGGMKWILIMWLYTRITEARGSPLSYSKRLENLLKKMEEDKIKF